MRGGETVEGCQLGEDSVKGMALQLKNGVIWMKGEIHKLVKRDNRQIDKMR